MTGYSQAMKGPRGRFGRCPVRHKALTRLLLVAWLLAIGGCRIAPATDGGLPDAALDDSGTQTRDAGIALHFEHWADGGDFSPGVLSLELLGPASYQTRGISINNTGDMLAQVDDPDASFGSHVVLEPVLLASGGGTERFVGFTAEPGLIADDGSLYLSTISTNPAAPVVRRFADGGVSELPFIQCNSAASSGAGWAAGLLLSSLREEPAQQAVMKPDGGLIRYSWPHQPMGINSSGVSVGAVPVPDTTAIGGYRYRIAIYFDGDAGILPIQVGVETDGAQCISDEGFIGGWEDMADNGHPAVWYGGTSVALPRRFASVANSAWVSSVNNLGVATGEEHRSVFVGDDNRVGWAFVWARGQYYLVDDFFPDSGMAFETAVSVNDASQLVGRMRFLDGGDTYAYRLSLSVDAGGWR